ncbi:MAG TPA: antitoxin Xre/MbcA/ParS toxin-binding domain-containing protein [Opitutales bacterium]|nr:antitoxin Xre/MbcA/ParS toxin-binding domain-containing protein [Opitutales bacterium]
MSYKQKGKNEKIEEPAAIYGKAPGRHRGRAMNAPETVATIRAGLPMVEFEALQELLALGAEELAGHLCISRSTLIRRRKAGRLDMQESDRLLRYARLFARAEEVLGSAESAREWLHSPARALGYVRPLEFAETEAGARETENILGRIEHGVFS